MDNTPFTPGDFWLIVKRRKWSLILITTLVLAITAAVALLLPSTYRSYATIMIEEQHIPTDFVMTTVSTFAEQRVENIKQRVLSFTKLSEIIIEHNLYQELKGKLTQDQIVSRMRKDINVKMIEAKIAGTGKGGSGSTSFILSYEGKHPQSVLRVTDALTTHFLQQNLEVRQKQITDTSNFLAEEAKRIKEELSLVEGEFSAFKMEHITELPELFTTNIESLTFVERNIERLNSDLHSLKDQEEYLRAQLISMAPSMENLQVSNEKIAMLNQLKLQFAEMKNRYTDEYPELASLKDRIAELEKQTGQETQASPARLPDNPAYVTLKAQLVNTVADIASAKMQLEQFHKQAADYRQRIEATPKVEERYQTMVNSRNALLAKYNDLLQKHQEARVAQELEKDQKGERFTLIEPARLPEKPHKPNRLAIVLVGVVLALGSSIGFAAIREFVDQSIRSSDSLEALTGVPVLAVIPLMITPHEHAQRRRRFIIVCISSLLLSLTAIVVFHFFIMDLHVFWAKVGRGLDRL